MKKLKILDLPFLSVTCDYKDHAARVCRKLPAIKNPNLSDYFAGLDFPNVRHICLSGMPGIAKSHTINASRRFHEKINNFIPTTTKGSLYNISNHHVVEYFAINCWLKSRDVEGHYIWDRSSLDNVMYHAASQLMYHYNNVLKEPIPVTSGVAPNDPTVNDFLALYAMSVHLGDLLRFMRSVEGPYTRIIFLVSSDLRLTLCSLLKRGDRNDIAYAKDHNYQAAVFCVAKYLHAMIRDSVFIDLALHIKLEHGALDAFQQALLREIDCPCPFGHDASIHEDPLHTFTDEEQQSLECSQRLVQSYRLNDTLMYELSNK